MSGQTKRRKPYPRRRQPRKTVFTTTMWAQWLSEQPWASPSPDEQAVRLRAGIEEFRSRVIVTPGKEAWS
jgi:hypothetical protein